MNFIKGFAKQSEMDHNFTTLKGKPIPTRELGFWSYDILSWVQHCLLPDNTLLYIEGLLIEKLISSKF